EVPGDQERQTERQEQADGGGVQDAADRQVRGGAGGAIRSKGGETQRQVRARTGFRHRLGDQVVARLAERRAADGVSEVDRGRDRNGSSDPRSRPWPGGMDRSESQTRMSSQRSSTYCAIAPRV